MSTVDQSQRTAAKVAGVSCLFSFALVVWVNFGIIGRLVVRGDASATANNILTHERMFRIGAVGDLLYGIGVIVLLSSLYVILKPVNQYLALLAAFGRLVHAFTWLTVTLNLFTALRLIHGADYLRSLGSTEAFAWARLYLNGSDGYYIGLLFWSLGATAGSHLWLRSRFIPRPFAAFGLLASAWCAVCTFAFFIEPGFSNTVNLWWFDSPMAVFELSLSIWLLFKGLRSA